MPTIQSYITTRRNKIRLGVVLGLNTVSFGSTQAVTFGVLTENTYGKFDVIDKSKAFTEKVNNIIGSGSLSLDNTAFVDGVNQTKLIPAIIGSGSLFVDIFSRNYDFKYKGRGLISLNDNSGLTNTVGIRAPYQARGVFNFSGISINSFSPKTYESTGLFNFNGNSSDRKISVYGYYGDDADPGTSGIIAVGQQTLLTDKKKTKSYTGSGALEFSEELILRRSYGYSGEGNLVFSDKGAESRAVSPQSDAQLFAISGTSLENTIKIVPQNTVSYNFDGIARIRVNLPYRGLGTISVQGNSETALTRSQVTSGLFRFTRHNTDNLFDTCDDIILTSDNQHSGSVSVVLNYSTTVGGITFDDTSVNSKISSYSYDGHNTYGIFGTYENLKFGYSDVGLGTISLSSSFDQIDTKISVNEYIGFGSIFNISGSSNSQSKKVLQSTILSIISGSAETKVEYPIPTINEYIGFGSIFNISGSSNSQSKKVLQSTILSIISGSAETKVELNFAFTGNGLVGFNEFGDTRKISNYSKTGFVNFNLYGELTHPDVRFVPSKISSGFVNISGFAEESVSIIYEKTFGTFVQFSTGLENFSKSTYIGIGSICVQEISNSTINNPFEISRNYVSII